MQRRPDDPPHIKRMFEARNKLIEARAEMVWPRDEMLEVAAGAVTCAISYLADCIETRRRDFDQQKQSA